VDLPQETNEDLSSLRTNSKQAGEYDGDHNPNEHTIIRDDGGDSKKAEEVQGMARNKVKQSNSALETTPEHWPGLGPFFEPAWEGIIPCTPLPNKS